MALRTPDRETDNSVYDDDKPGWRDPGAIGNLERSFGAPSATDEDLPEGHPDATNAKKLDSDELSAKEGATAGEADTGTSSPFSFNNDDKDTGIGSKLRGSLKERFGKGGSRRTTSLIAGAGGGVLLLALVFGLMFFLSSLKVVNFGEVLATAGYARFRGITNERMSQDIFDASAVVGDGTVKAPKGKLIDRILLRNVSGQISDLGREGKLKFLTENEKLSGVRLGNDTITLDGTTRELGFADSYKDASFSEKLTIRNKFVDTIKVSAGENLALEPRYIQGAVFDTIAKETGFGFQRWKNPLRDFFGKSPHEAVLEDRLNSTEDISGQHSITTGVGEVDENSKLFKNKEKLKGYLEKNGNVFNEEEFIKSVKADNAKANGISEASSKISMGVLILSLSCMANQTFSHAGEVQKNNEIEATKMGLQLVAARDEIKSVNVGSLAMMAAASQVDGGDRAPGYQDATGRPITSDGSDNPRIAPDPTKAAIAETVTKLTSPSRMLTGSDGGLLVQNFPGGADAIKKLDSEFCDKILSPGGALTIAGIDIIAQVAVDILTDGGGTLIEQGGGRVAASVIINELASATFNTVREVVSAKSAATLLGMELYSMGLKYAAASLSATTFSGTENGSDYVQRAFIGTNVLQNRQVRTMYGRPLTDAEASSVDEQYAAADKQELQKQSVFARYFSPHNPYSITGNLAMAIPSSTTTALASFRTSITNIGSSLQPLAAGGLLQHLLPGFNRSAAALSYNKYNNNKQWGFSPAERNKMRNDPTYGIAQNELYITPAQIAALDSSIGPCYDPSKTQYEIEVEKKDQCNADTLGTDEALRYRIYKLDSALADETTQNLSAPSSDSPGGATNTSDNMSGDFGWPMTDKSSIMQCFTWNGQSGHPGVDISGGDGTPIFAIADGVVDNVKAVDGYGTHFVSIKHTNGFGSSYGHMKAATVQVGQNVKRGDQIGLQGNEDQRGQSTGSHLHLNLFKGAYSGSDTGNIDPLKNGLTVPASVGGKKCT